VAVPAELVFGLAGVRLIAGLLNFAVDASVIAVSASIGIVASGAVVATGATTGAFWTAFGCSAFTLALSTCGDDADLIDSDKNDFTSGRFQTAAATPEINPTPKATRTSVVHLGTIRIARARPGLNRRSSTG
jgi:hypothetical protein